MGDLATNESPTEAIGAILRVLGITQVVFVDDLFAKTIELADAQTAQLSLPPEQALEVIGSTDLSFPDDPDIRRQAFERYWESLAPQDREDLGRRLLVVTGATQSVRPEDVGAARALADIVGAERLLTLSPLKWIEQRDAILENAKAGRALLLFDQDLRDDNGTATGGMAMIAAVLASPDTPSVMCGLLSHTVTIDCETEEWERLAEDHHVDRDRFVVIAKENLSTDQLQFARMLKLVALAPDCRKVKDRVHQILINSTTEAANGVAAIDVFEFEHMVLRIAHTEGVGEQEMLFRLFAIFQRTELRKLASADAELAALLQRLRGISLIPTDSPAKPRLSTWKLQQQEMYEPADHINALHLPIEIGDVFAKTDESGAKNYILLGQPCDLMVRPEGERRPKVKEVLLGEIQLLEDPTSYDEHIPYFGDDPTKKHFVRFKRLHAVPVVILDLCVFNPDGVSRLNDTCPGNVHPAWQTRHVVIKKVLTAVLREYDQFGTGKAKNTILQELRKSLFEKFPPLVGKDGLFKPKMESVGGVATLVFNCARVRRLHRPRAAALALYYASCFSRPAFDRDLGADVQQV